MSELQTCYRLLLEAVGVDEQGLDPEAIALYTQCLHVLRNAYYLHEEGPSLVLGTCEALYMKAVYLSLAGDHATACTALEALKCQWKLSSGIWAACRQPPPQPPAACSRAAAEPAPSLLTKQQPTTESIAISGKPDKVLVLDQCLPRALHSRLEEALAPAGSYWEAHSYWQRGTPFFSHLYELARPPRTIAEHAAQQVLSLLRCIPAAAQQLQGVDRVEWWAHTRDPSELHQLHFDANETRFRKGRHSYSLQHPQLSTVLYLTSTGGPTIVLDQTPHTPLASSGWAVSPAPNRLLAFPGALLHGVLPAAAPGQFPAPHAAARTTLVMAFWHHSVTLHTPNVSSPQHVHSSIDDARTSSLSTPAAAATCNDTAANLHRPHLPPQPHDLPTVRTNESGGSTPGCLEAASDQADGPPARECRAPEAVGPCMRWPDSSAALSGGNSAAHAARVGMLEQFEWPVASTGGTCDAGSSPRTGSGSVGVEAACSAVGGPTAVVAAYALRISPAFAPVWTETGSASKYDTSPFDTGTDDEGAQEPDIVGEGAAARPTAGRPNGWPPAAFLPPLRIFLQTADEIRDAYVPAA